MAVTCLHYCRGEYKLQQLLDKLEGDCNSSQNIFHLRSKVKTVLLEPEIILAKATCPQFPVAQAVAC
jgi:hypothetical protein